LVTKRNAAVFGLAIAFACSSAGADCFTNARGETVCGKGKCEADQYQKVYCAPAGGDAVRDSYGNVLCGKGSCSPDSNGKLWCSKEVGGGAATDASGNVKCLGGCEEASKARCEEGK